MGIVAALGACDERESLRPFGEALVQVDTDLPFALAGRLRVDLYASGTWFETRDVTRAAAEEWPTSFSVFSDDDRREKLVWVRLRLSPLGHERDYLGERFRPRGAEATSIDPEARPRLVRDGADTTPKAEPDPWVTVDRLLYLRLRPGVRGAVRVVLRGSCAGTMSKLATRSDGPLPVFGEAATCVDGDGALVRVDETPLSLDRTTTAATLLGTFGRDECTPDDRPSASNVDAVCIPGGTGLFGSADFLLDLGVPAWPERVVRTRRFFLDRREVTVARYRAALAAGFAPTTLSPLANEGPLSTATDYRDPGYCTFSEQPLGREDLPITCIPWDTARRFCEHAGGDLPTEAQWEHAASVAGRSAPTAYPWGDARPTCDAAVFGRAVPASPPGAQPDCLDRPQGPRPVAESDIDTTPLGVLGLAGGVGEWTRDASDLYDGRCWSALPVDDPWCAAPFLTRRSIRGGGWTTDANYLFVRRRFRGEVSSRETMIGFRCVYPARGPS